MSSADDAEASGDEFAAPDENDTDNDIGNDTGDDTGTPDDDAADQDERFTRYQNSVYRYVSLGGSALILILGITGFVIARTVEPAPPAQFFFVEGILTVLLLLWYALGLRCRLDVAETWVHIATKYGDFRIDRDRVVSIEADRSIRGSIQWSGRPLILRYRPTGKDDAIKTRKAYGCLPNDPRTQAKTIEILQSDLGSPEDQRGDASQAGVASADAVVRHLHAGATESADSDDVAAAVAARLATMKPEGDQES